MQYCQTSMSLFISYCFFVLFQAHCRFVVVPLLFASLRIPKLLWTTLWHIYFKHKFSMHRFFNNSITFQQQISGTIFFALRFCQRNFSRLLLAEIPLCPLPSSFTGFAISPYLTFIRIQAKKGKHCKRWNFFTANDVKSLIYVQVKHLWLALFA